jgi:hypothetical protein
MDLAINGNASYRPSAFAQVVLTPEQIQSGSIAYRPSDVADGTLLNDVSFQEKKKQLRSDLKARKKANQALKRLARLQPDQPPPSGRAAFVKK